MYEYTNTVLYIYDTHTTICVYIYIYHLSIYSFIDFWLPSIKEGKVICEINGWVPEGVQFGVVTVRARIFARSTAGCFGGAIWGPCWCALLIIPSCPVPFFLCLGRASLESHLTQTSEEFTTHNLPDRAHTDEQSLFCSAPEPRRLE